MSSQTHPEMRLTDKELAAWIRSGPRNLLAWETKRLLATIQSDRGKLAGLEAEREFLLARSAGANRASFGDADRWTGTSSNALVRVVFGGHNLTPSEYPHDPSDLAACARAVRRLPDHLRDRATPIMLDYRRVVAERYPLDEFDKAFPEWAS